MKIAKLTALRLSAFGLLLAVWTGIVLAGVEFSAETLQPGPQGQLSSGKLFVGQDRVRIETSHQGQEVVRIQDQKRGVEWILLPDQKSYMEQPLVGPGPQGPVGRPKPGEDPCAGLPGLTCRKLGEEQIAGRMAIKWEMVASREGQSLTSTQWIDKERGIPLRREMPDGRRLELAFVGKDTLDGRSVEKWETVVTTPGQPEIRSFQWYDPELGMWIRQEFPGGMVSELKNIRMGKQPDDLFQLPADFKRMSPPSGMPPEGTPDPSRR